MKYDRLDAEEIWEDESWKLCIASTTAVFSYSIVGVFSVDAVRIIFQRFEQFEKSHAPPYAVFINLAGTKTVTAQARIETIEGLKARRQRLATLHVLVRSSSIAMALNTIELLAGVRLKTYSERALWTAERDRLANEAP